MLGRVKRTSRLDVGLALAFAGLSYLVWSLVAGISRDTVTEMIKALSMEPGKIHLAAQWLKIVFVDAGIVIDIAGVVWMAGTLVLVMGASRQRMSISWAWVCAATQICVAAVGSVLVGAAAQLPYRIPEGVVVPQTIWGQLSRFSLAVALVIGLVVWVVFLVLLLMERSRVSRLGRGPSLTDGLRTNTYQ